MSTMPYLYVDDHLDNPPTADTHQVYLFVCCYAGEGRQEGRDQPSPRGQIR